MSILDTFFILFKSNAAEVKKDMGEAEKATNNFQDKINQADKVTSNLATSLLSIATTGIAAFASFEGLRHGIGDAITMNAELYRQSNLLGESSENLKALDTTFSQITQKKGQFVEWFGQVASELRSMGNAQGVQYIIPKLLEAADAMKKLADAGDISGARNIFGILQTQWHLPEDFFNAMVLGKDALQGLIDKNKELNNVTDEGTKNAQRLEKAWSSLADRFKGYFTSFSNLFTLPSAVVLENVQEKTNAEQSIKNWGDFFHGRWGERTKNIAEAASSNLSAMDNNPLNTSNGIYVSGNAPPVTIDTINVYTKAMNADEIARELPEHIKRELSQTANQYSSPNKK